MAIDFKSAPFDKAIAYLENRIALPSERWNDYQDSEANAAFWSAGAVDATLVGDLQKSVTRAIANGTPYDSPEFAAQIANFSEQYGWDIKGGADWRARLILSQNLRQSYAAGRHDQQYDPDVMKLQPYLQYVHSDSRAPRPAHFALDGKVFRKDDPIWGSITPPNGFNCGCYTVSLSQRQLDKKGLEVEKLELGDTLPYVDRNGITKQAIVKPDDGFNSAPSSDAQQRQANLERIKERLDKSWGKRIDNAILDLRASQLAINPNPVKPSETFGESYKIDGNNLSINASETSLRVDGVDLPSIEVNISVNGGSVRDEIKGSELSKIKLGLKSKQVITDWVKSLPDGRILENTPETRDDAGDARIRLYKLGGFGDPDDTYGRMHGIVKNGKIKPVNIEEINDWVKKNG